jgi:hypothetical protein
MSATHQEWEKIDKKRLENFCGLKCQFISHCAAHTRREKRYTCNLTNFIPLVSSSRVNIVHAAGRIASSEFIQKGSLEIRPDLVVDKARF